MAEHQREDRVLSDLKAENIKLLTENNVLRADIGYWKSFHRQAVEREESFKKELQDKNARIKYLTGQLYEKKTEQSKKRTESDKQASGPRERKRGQQPDRPAPKPRDQSHLPAQEEVHDLSESEKYCSTCGLPFVEMPDTEDSEVLETQEVSGYSRKIRRKKYKPGCKCPGNKGIITAPGPAKLIPHSRYGASVWIHILIRKYRFQIPVARILKNLALHGLSLPPGSAGDGLKRLAPLFEPVYAALEERSEQAAWWQADETRWSVFERTKTKSTFRWYLWVFISNESVVHVIDPTRSAQVIEDHLGCVVDRILLVDRYSAYKSYAKKHEGIILAFCWAHARRDFREAGLKYAQVREWAGEWEERINALFHLNKVRVQYAPGSSALCREDARLREAAAEMKEILREERKKKRLHHSQMSVLKSLATHWEGLMIFVDHPEIPMDNNGSERTLRNPVVGRKNYYGSGAIWSARFTAVMFSIFETLELWKINQLEWLSDYFRACALAGGKAPADIAAHLPWNIKEREAKTQVYCGRVFTESELECIRGVIGEDTARNRTAISRIACEQLQWYKPDGTAKWQSMRQVLVKMEADGHITLPPLLRTHSTRMKPIVHTERTAKGEEILVPAGYLSPIHIEIAKTEEEKSLWNEYIDRYHYLGYTTLPGAQMKYFVYAGGRLLALMGFGASAWRVAPRDWYIGWSDEKRQANLHLVVNNARFLILPWVCSKNLASKILSLTTKRIAEDWQNRYKYKPVLLETFVEKNRFSGTCYKAANWKLVGTTKGRGKKDIFKDASLPKKDIYMYPLEKNFQTMLC
ncbi:MAG: IS66 family transposase [Nitrospinaceae bacterium]|jgi:transposase|nr:IS66 family transposase [Nitrospinaceae bacterium]|tara:strand:- start:42 stop:2471 length:2430 start_codon:yes stop_codon:yes gene_type:complete